MADRIDPLDLLAFIESGMSMTGEKIAARWPEWHRLSQDAYARWERESEAHRIKWRSNVGSCSDPMVGSAQEAIKHWVHLPLIRQCLAQEEFS